MMIIITITVYNLIMKWKELNPSEFENEKKGREKLSGYYITYKTYEKLSSIRH